MTRSVNDDASESVGGAVTGTMGATPEHAARSINAPKAAKRAPFVADICHTLVIALSADQRPVRI